MPISETISSPDTFRLTEIVVSMIIMKIPAISSITSVPRTICANFSFFKLYSSYALRIIIVDDILSIPPRKMQSILPHPSRLPTPVPMRSIALMTVSAITNALPPTVAIFLKLNSSPSPNIRNTTPIFAQT